MVWIFCKGIVEGQTPNSKFRLVRDVAVQAHPPARAQSDSGAGLGYFSRLHGQGCCKKPHQKTEKCWKIGAVNSRSR